MEVRPIHKAILSYLGKRLGIVVKGGDCQAMFEKAAERAPKGGITLGSRNGESRFFAGGTWIPSRDVAAASPEERTELAERKAGARPNPLNKREKASAAARDKRGTRDQIRKRVADIATDIMVRSGDRTPDKYRDLAAAVAEGARDGHLRVEDLRALRLKLSSSFGGGRRKDQMVAALLDHANAAAEELEAEKRAERRAAQKKSEKKVPRESNSILSKVIDYGGIDPNSHEFLTSYEGVRAAQQDGIPLLAFRTGGRGLDQIARELEANGHIHVPEDEHAGSYVLDLLREKAVSLHADLTKKYERAEREYWKARQDAAAEHGPAEVEAAARSGAKVGRAEGAGDAGGEHSAGADAGSGQADWMKMSDAEFFQWFTAPPEPVTETKLEPGALFSRKRRDAIKTAPGKTLPTDAEDVGIAPAPQLSSPNEPSEKLAADAGEWSPIAKDGSDSEGENPTFRVGADRFGKTLPTKEDAHKEEIASRAAEALGLPGPQFRATVSPDGKPAVVSKWLDAHPANGHSGAGAAFAKLTPDDVARHTLHAYLTADNDHYNGKNFMIDRQGNLIPVDYGAAFSPDDSQDHAAGVVAGKYNLPFQSAHGSIEDGFKAPVSKKELARAVSAGEQMVRDMESRGLRAEDIAGARQRLDHLKAVAARPNPTYGDVLSEEPATPVKDDSRKNTGPGGGALSSPNEPASAGAAPASPLHALARFAGNPAALKAESEKLAADAGKRGGDLSFHDAMTAALRGEHGGDVRDAVSTALDDWDSHKGDLAKRYARVAQGVAGIGKQDPQEAPQAAAPAPEPQGQGALGKESAPAPSAPDVLPGGRADNAPDSAFPPAALAEGAAHEREHTTDSATAKEIAKDHLAEDGKYYDKLAKMEGKKGGAATEAADHKKPSSPNESVHSGATPKPESTNLPEPAVEVNKPDAADAPAEKPIMVSGFSGYGEFKMPKPVAPGVSPNHVPLATAQRAYSAISQYPERRGYQEQADYVNQMNADWEHLSQYADTPEKREQLKEEFERYRQGYLNKQLARLHATSRTASSFITGPSKFPTASNRKKLETEHKRNTEHIEFRERALKAIKKKLAPELGPIKSSDADAVSALRQKHESMKVQHERWKAVNEAHRKFLKDPKSLDSAELPEDVKNTIRNYKPKYSWEPHPIPPYVFQNHSANMRRVQQRIEEVSKMQSGSAKSEEYTGGVTVEESPDDGRIRIKFPGKPSREAIESLKGRGFRWSPTAGAWQRHLNASGRAAVNGFLDQHGHTPVPSAPAAAAEPAEDRDAVPAPISPASDADPVPIEREAADYAEQSAREIVATPDQSERGKSQAVASSFAPATDAAAAASFAAHAAPPAPKAPKPVHEFSGPNGMRSTVHHNPGNPRPYSVALHDDEAGETVPNVRHFYDADKAREHAQSLVAGPKDAPTDHEYPAIANRSDPHVAPVVHGVTGNHLPAITAIPKGDSRFIAGHRVRHTEDGRFQVEDKPKYEFVKGERKKTGGFLTGTARQVADHINARWKGEAKWKRLPDALARAANHEDADPFTDPGAADREAKARARVPDGTHAVSLDEATRGRVGQVRRDPETGQAWLDLGEETRGTDFEPIEEGHSWRTGTAKAEKPKGESAALFDGGEKPKTGAAAPPTESATSVTPAPGSPPDGSSAKSPRRPKAKNIPAKQPREVTVANHAKLKSAIKSKYVPRPPRDDEATLLLQRPQTGPYQFHEYAVGDLIGDHVVTAAKPGFTRGGEGFKRWEQIVIARPATPDDHNAVAAQRAEQSAPNSIPYYDRLG